MAASFKGKAPFISQLAKQSSLEQKKHYRIIIDKINTLQYIDINQLAFANRREIIYFIRLKYYMMNIYN